MAKTTRVHVDTLKYTRQGLRTRAGIPLHVSHHNKIVIVRPERVVPFAAGYAGFPEASAFPGPPVLSLMRTLADAAGEGSRIRSSVTPMPRSLRPKTRRSRI